MASIDDRTIINLRRLIRGTHENLRPFARLLVADIIEAVMHEAKSRREIQDELPEQYGLYKQRLEHVLRKLAKFGILKTDIKDEHGRAVTYYWLVEGVTRSTILEQLRVLRSIKKPFEETLRDEFEDWFEQVDSMIETGVEFAWRQIVPGWHPRVGVWCDDRSRLPEIEQTANMLSGIVEYCEEYAEGVLRPEDMQELKAGCEYILSKQRLGGAWRNFYLFSLRDPRITGSLITTLSRIAVYLPDLKDKIRESVCSGYIYLKKKWRFDKEPPITTPFGMEYKAQTPLGAVLTSASGIIAAWNADFLPASEEEYVRKMLQYAEGYVRKDPKWKNEAKWTMWITRFLVENLGRSLENEEGLIAFLKDDKQVKRLLSEAEDHAFLPANYARTLCSLGVYPLDRNVKRMIEYLQKRWSDRLGFGGYEETAGVVRNLIKYRKFAREWKSKIYLGKI